ncbi:MAG: glucosamine-6-phosphate deaminase [Candidatus Xenobia bacterium]
MEVIIEPDVDAAAELAARILVRRIREHPASVLGLATGGTQERVYAALLRLVHSDRIPTDQLVTFNLDEYVGLAPDHPASYHRYMQQHLFAAMEGGPKRINIPNGLARDIVAECAGYEQAIREAGGIDLQLLGIGEDGHIGFNEPTSSLGSRTRLKTLTAETRWINRAFFKPDEEVPHHVITMGVVTIMEARTCLMVAFGERKAAAIAAMVEGPVTAMFPASALQYHRDTMVVIDEPAASQLKLRDYYQGVYAAKPAWQRRD